MKAGGNKFLKAKIGEFLRQVEAYFRPVPSSAEDFFQQAQRNGTMVLRSDDSGEFPKFTDVQWMEKPSGAELLNELRGE